MDAGDVQGLAERCVGDQAVMQQGCEVRFSDACRSVKDDVVCGATGCAFGDFFEDVVEELVASGEEEVEDFRGGVVS